MTSSTPSSCDRKEGAGVESFSFVEDPTIRFVAALGVQPEPAEASDSSMSNLNNPPSSSSSAYHNSTFTAGTMGDTARSSLSRTVPTGAKATPASRAALSSAPTLAPLQPHQDGQQQEGRTRSASRSRRRLTASLGNLLRKDKRSDERNADQDGTSVPAGPLENGTGSGRRSLSSSRRQSLEMSPTATPNATFPHPPLDQSLSRSIKPPVSLPSLFRRRNSNSQTASSVQQIAEVAAGSTPPSSAAPMSFRESSRRRSLEAGRAGSSSSVESYLAVDGPASLVSTAPTSPEGGALPLARGGVERSAQEPLSGQEKRRRGSLALARELSRSGLTDEEDLSAFVAASGSSSLSPSLPVAPFASPRAPFSSTTNIAHNSPSSSPPTDDSITVPTRRMSRNVDGLSLGAVRTGPPLTTSSPRTTAPAPPLPSSPVHSSPPTTSYQTTIPPPAIPPTTSASIETETRTSTPDSGNAAQRERLGALPRLLSASSIPAYVTNGGEGEEQEEEEEGEESETENEGEDAASSSSGDEGEQYATSDEGPITMRSRDVTPAQTPMPHVPTPGGRPASSGGASFHSSRMPSFTGLSRSTASGGPPLANWVSFAPSTPTPSVRTARQQPNVETGPTSYFDLPRPLASSTSSSRTPFLPPQTPLAPMSISDVARGKRPALQDEVDASAAGAIGPAEEQTSTAEGSGPASTHADKGVRAGMYRMRSQSVVALASPSMVDSDDEPIGTAAVTGLDPVWQTAGGARTPGPSFLNLDNLATQVQTSTPPPKPPLSMSMGALPVGPRTPAALDIQPPPGSPASPAQSRTARPQPTEASHRLKRGRSMYELRDAPPAYSSVRGAPGLGRPQVIQPREEEGNEGLPGYTCSIHIEGYMPRKMEFTSPGVQAKDRAWKRQYVVLHGTSIKVYRSDLRTHPIAGEEDWSVIPVDIAGNDGPPPLHFHEGEYGVAPKDGEPRSKFPISISDVKVKAKLRIVEGSAAAMNNSLVRHYSLQNAESGLAADYIKRKHVVRVRAEGEQFLLQAKDDRGVIDMIEALQAATNVALDLDARPLPKFITLPRRRRRRRPRPDAANPDGTANPAAAEGNAADPAEGAARPTGGSPDRMGEMLAEEQNAYARRNSATVM
ncbi:hypothetical protein JCM11641_006635 [Rhodosporidiobolus odoratus]